MSMLGALNTRLRKSFDFFYKLNEVFSTKEKIKFLGVIIAVFGMAVFQAIGIASVLPFMNMIMNPEIIWKNSSLLYLYNLFHFQNVQSFITVYGFIALGLIIIGNLISAFTVWIRTLFIYNNNYKLSVRLFSRYLFSPYAYFLSHNTAELGKNILYEVETFTNAPSTPHCG